MSSSGAAVRLLARHTKALALVKSPRCPAAESLILAARAFGLGTCRIGLPRPSLNLGEARDKLSIPMGCSLVAPIIVGYPRVQALFKTAQPATTIWIP